MPLDDSTGGGFLGLSGKQWGGVGLAGLGGLFSLFGGDHGMGDAIGQLKDQSKQASDLGLQYGKQSQDLFGPVAQYLKGVTGDKAALDYATLPERRRVIDQYATAKKSLAEFAPRGGGQASALSNLNAKEAGDLATTEATARQQGFSSEAQLASQLASLGINEQSLASGDLNSMIQAISGQNAQSAAASGGLGSALGTIAGFLLL